jgi:hypothetical protein
MLGLTWSQGVRWDRRIFTREPLWTRTTMFFQLMYGPPDG